MSVLESTIPFFPPAVLKGSVDTITITEDVGTNPTSIIRTNSPWHIKVDWKLEGSLIPTPFFPPNENWVVRAFLESMGPGTEYEIPAHFGKPAPTLGFDLGTADPANPNKMNYSLTIDLDPAPLAVPGGPPPTPEPVDAGIYKLVVAVTSVEKGTGNPGSFAGFLEGMTLQFYDA